MRICIINTGGTIACAGQPLAPMPAGQFADAAQRVLGPSLRAAHPGLQLHFAADLRFGAADSGTLDSTDIGPQDWCAIAAAILDRYADHDAFVVLHGTDTMDFTGAALPLLLNVSDELGLPRATLSKPVILTGSQRPLLVQPAGGDPVLNAGSDAFANLSAAVAAAHLALPEVTLVFGGQMLRANRAMKTSTTRFDAFGSPHLPPLARIGIAITPDAPALPGPATPALALDHPRAMARARAQLAAVAGALPAGPGLHLPAVPAAPGVLAGMIDAAVAQGIGVLMLLAYGEGNFPADGGRVARALHDAVAAGVLVIDGTRVIRGSVEDFSYAAGAWMAGTGAVSALDMTPMAALAKGMILRAAAAHHGWDRACVARLVQRDLAGECRPRDRLAEGGAVMAGGRLTAAGGGAVLINDPDAGPQLWQDGAMVWQAGAAGRLVLRAGRVQVIGADSGIRWQGAAGVAGDLLILDHDRGGARLALHDPAGTRAPLPLHG